MRIAITADHNGVALKQRLAVVLREQGHDVDDRAPQVGAEIVDYPPLCADVCRQVADGAAERGIVVGGSGQGESIAANKVRGIRAALCHDEFTARLSRQHNDANVLSLGARVLAPELALVILDTWLAASFEGGRHVARIAQLAAIEEEECGH
jgi:ribose 5-phosphate isomerase B